MKYVTSRRQFLGAAVTAPVVMSGSVSAGFAPIARQQIPIEYRVLGNTGMKVSAVGFGCMLTSDPSVIERAVAAGINFFDTARDYQRGNNERMVGAALKPVREKVVLCTKSGARDAAGLREDLETSLRELDTDYIDVWCLHGRSSVAEVTDELIGVMVQAKREGKVRFAGVSTHSNQKQLLRDLAETPEIDVILAAYNFTMDEDMQAAVAEARRAGKGIVAMKVMPAVSGGSAKGILCTRNCNVPGLSWPLSGGSSGTATSTRPSRA